MDAISLGGFNEKPDFVNEQGVKWWVFKYMTEYARKPNKDGKFLKTAVAWKVQEPNGKEIYIVTDNNNVIAENQSLEAIGAKIDFLKMAL